MEQQNSVETKVTGSDKLFQNLSVMIISGEFVKAREIISKSRGIILKKTKPEMRDFVILGQLSCLENRWNILESSL